MSRLGRCRRARPAARRTAFRTGARCARRAWRSCASPTTAHSGTTTRSAVRDRMPSSARPRRLVQRARLGRRRRSGCQASSSTPSVWQVGQYCAAAPENEYSWILPPQRQQVSPVRRWTRSAAIFEARSSAGGTPRRPSVAADQHGARLEVEARDLLVRQHRRVHHGRDLGGVEDLVRVGVADAGERGLILQQRLDLLAAPGEDARRTPPR